MEFKQYRDELYQKWQKRILSMCWGIAGIIFIIEVAVFLLMFFSKVLDVPAPVYVLERVVIPTVINLSAILTASFIQRGSRSGEAVKNAAVCFALWTACSVVAVFHNYFSVLLIVPTVPVFLSAIFADKKLIRIMFIASILSIAAALSVWAHDPWNRNSAGLIAANAVVCGASLVCCYIFAMLIMKSQKEQIDYLYAGYCRQLELIHELRVEPLTRLYNRTALDECIDVYMRKFDEGIYFPHMVMIDIDHFKRINDKYGHTNGDIVLMKLSDVIRRRLGGSRHAFRYGGEEFVLLFDKEPADEVINIVEDIRSEFGKQRYPFNVKERVTFSAGIAAFRSGVSRTGWVGLADAAMYQAKDAGRNKVVMAE